MKFKFNLDKELISGMKELSRYFGIEDSSEGILLCSEKCDKGIKVIATTDKITIYYSSVARFFYAFSFCIQNYGKSFTLERSCEPERLGIMRDCARNAILSVEGAEKLILNSVILGYNYLELYMEDLMDIPSLPYLGHNRGRYTKEEIKRIDDYAAMFGVELVPCVQALAHLPHIFRHDCFLPINDMNDILLVDDENTYEFIEKVISFLSECFSSKRVNLCMDEAFNMGLGKYLVKHGFVADRGAIFLRHLSRVFDICKKYGFKPQIFSDMIFRVGLDNREMHSYMGIEGKHFKKEFVDTFPKDISLIFWDYYHVNEDFYDSVFDKHFELTDNVVFAGGVWTWIGFAPNNTWAERTLSPAIDSFRKHSCKDFMLTVWGDGGAESSAFSIFSTLLWTAEKLFADDTDADYLNRRADALFGNSYEELKNIENVNRTSDNSIEDGLTRQATINPTKYTLYNDPLLGILDSHVYDEMKKYFARNAAEMKKYADRKGRFSYLYETMFRLADCLTVKATLGIDLKKYYDERNKKGMIEIAEETIPECLKKLDAFYEAFRVQWHKENKSFGFEVFDIRIGGLKQRLMNCARIIKEYAEGKTEKIDELERKRLPVCSTMSEKEDICFNSFCWNISGSLI